MDERFTTLELMQAMQLGHAVAALHALGVMDALAQAREPEDLARRLGLDAALLAGLLDHAARTTDLVRRKGRRYRTTRSWNREARFLVNLYGLAFGGAAAQVQTLLCRPELASRLVDRQRLAQAFDTSPHEAAGVLPGLLRQLDIDRVLDLGCGPASLLIQLALSDPGFRGWGVEANAAMCVAARASVRKAGVARRVRLLRGDARRIGDIVPPSVAAQVQAVVASQFVNEMFGAGPSAAIAWLRSMRRVLPGRLLLVADYYGRLGSSLAVDERLTLLHDHAQLVSGQGVPPARRRDWAALYARAGGRLVHSLEDRLTTRFIHVVAL
jgi:SAM-dependent methyltransferase